MGACLSCCPQEDNRASGDANERTHLLVDPVSSSSNNIHRVQSDEYIQRYPSSLPKRNDEQSALSRILHETATNVIDVSALDSHDLEQHEYYERMKAYNVRLNSQLKWTPPHQNRMLLNDVPSPEKHLSSDPISADNVYLITRALDLVSDAVCSVTVEHKEDLVVPFQIP